MDARRSEVLRLFDRYRVEVVEAYELCPWARGARLAVDVVWDTPTVDEWVEAATRLLAGAAVAMVIAPELAAPPAELRRIRDAVAARLGEAGVADFHPDAELDVTTPARLVPFLRRSPDPLLPLVPLAILDEVRATRPAPGRSQQAQILGGHATAPKPDVADRIAAANHARVTRDAGAIAARLDDIAEDRRRSYARVGISRSRSR